ncbi:MAG: CHAD domain-containing protein [Pseudomonadota bacterium]|nr:CHAD domain-containing protein [Pseudomonadota bacterium]
MANSQKRGINAGLARDALIVQINQVIHALQRRKLTDEAVHEARRGVKRSRAILRLLRYLIGTPTYRFQNRLLRDTARPLTALRDAKVLIEALQRLARKCIPLVRLLKKDLDDCRQQLSPQQVSDVTASLQDVKVRLEGIDEKTLQQMITRKDLDRIYRKGRSAFAGVKKSGTDARLHEWRKQVKYLLHQIELVRGFGVRHLGKPRRQADRLAEILGNDHDLAVLKNKIRGFVAAGKMHDSAATSKASVVRSLARRLERQRCALQRKARRLGSSLFAAKRHVVKKWRVQTVKKT